MLAVLTLSSSPWENSVLSTSTSISSADEVRKMEEEAKRIIVSAQKSTFKGTFAQQWVKDEALRYCCSSASKMETFENSL